MSEVLVDRPGRRLALLEATAERCVTRTRHAAGQEGTDPHVHLGHADVFFVLEGELTLPVGVAGERLVATAGTFVSVPPLVVHGFVNASDAEAEWLNVHAPDGGFAAFLRSGAPWDSHDPPADGGGPADSVEVVPEGAARLAALGVTHLP